MGGIKSSFNTIWQRKWALICWLFSTLIREISSDLPPNCIHGDVVGTWRIHVGTYKPCPLDQKFEDPTCGFPSPDRDFAHNLLTPTERGLINDNFKLSFTFDVKFEDSELKVISTQNLDGVDTKKFNNFEKVGTVGNWTVILDQAFTFWTKSYRYTAFFKYINEYEDINASYCYCHTTLLGWWDSYPESVISNQDNKEENRILSLEERGKYDNHPWLVMSEDLKLRRGCWYGMRIFDGDGKTTDRTEWTLKLPRWRSSPLGLPPDHPVNAQNPTIAEYLNEVSAKYSGFENRNKLWNRSNKFEIENSQNLDTLPKVRKALKISPHFVQRKKSNEEYITEISSVREEEQISGSKKNSSDEPIWMRIRSFDWSNPEHVYGRLGKKVKLVPEVFNQGDCGDCFAVTAATIITSRLWIKYSSDPDIVRKVYASSIQMSECNVYNQGCGGGLITLAFRFAQEIGIRTQDCIHDYAEHLGLKKIYPTPVHTPDEVGIADDGHSFLQTKGGKEFENQGSQIEEVRQQEEYDQENGQQQDKYYENGQAQKYREDYKDDMEEHLDGASNVEHISNLHDYYEGSDDENSSDNEHLEHFNNEKYSIPTKKFNVIQQLCWDLGGQMGAANTQCRKGIPITKNIPNSCSKIIKVREYSYVNNVYGRTTPRDIMESLWNEGPIAVSLEPTLEFSLYNSGVFKGFYDPITRQYPWSSIPWYKVDHAMVITGWGWETYGNERVPYWIVQNSWGKRWGEKGFCRIIRGVNELSIEHAAVRASVTIYENNKKYKVTDLQKVHDESVFQYL
ncbi:secreted papain like protease [Cryptosporidium sp. chipmunk genotype I]|uniref:secreted papain like protease n=1 Tax=Cryptosporidium sp. chipmunk genotype I TaxID=1280935 RepID=UPI00351A2E17|nr:secreted papain like protease [Cryptosporidium sp. chipmunk genotype I]